MFVRLFVYSLLGAMCGVVWAALIIGVIIFIRMWGV